MNVLHGRRGSLLALLASLSALLLAGGCALVPEEVSRSEPSAYLEYSPQIYARLSGQALRDITKGMNDEELSDFLTTLMSNPQVSQQAGQLSGQQGSSPQGQGAGVGSPSASSNATIDASFIKGFLDKTNSFGAGVRGIGTDQPRAEAVFLGRFSPISLRLALTMEGNWRHLDDGGYKSVQYPLYLRSPQAGWIHLSTEANPPQKAVLPLPFPEPMKALALSDIFISINDPKILFSGTLPLEASAIPLETVLVSGIIDSSGSAAVPVSSSGPGSPADALRNYAIELRVVAKDEATARAYRPVIRFLWAATAVRIFGNRGDIAALPLSLEGSVYVVRGIRLSGSEIRDILKPKGMPGGLTP